MSSSVHANNREKNILVPGQGIAQGLDDTKLTAEKIYQVNFGATEKKLCWSLYYNGSKSYLFVNGIEIIKFKAKGYEIVENPLCLGNISEDFSVTNIKKHDYMELFMILVLIIELLQLMIY